MPYHLFPFIALRSASGYFTLGELLKQSSGGRVRTSYCKIVANVVSDNDFFFLKSFIEKPAVMWCNYCLYRNIFQRTSV